MALSSLKPLLEYSSRDDPRAMIIVGQATKFFLQFFIVFKRHADPPHASRKESFCWVRSNSSIFFILSASHCLIASVCVVRKDLASKMSRVCASWSTNCWAFRKLSKIDLNRLSKFFHNDSNVIFQTEAIIWLELVARWNALRLSTTYRVDRDIYMRFDGIQEC